MELKVKSNQRYKSINWTSAHDKKLSLKAKGLMYYLLMKPPNWSGQLYEIISNNKDGRKSVLSAIKELKEAGYIITKSKPLIDGKFQGKYYEISEEPQKKK
jgi:biotin operon repressor